LVRVGSVLAHEATDDVKMTFAGGVKQGSLRI
jgi:hypothetical protein